jgi:DNA repair exonuclease SbcCD ATPase subunit
MSEEELHTKINALKELLTEKVDHLEQLNTERYDTAAQALKIQAREYERRLEALNGEANRLRELEATYVSKEFYEAHHEGIHSEISDLKGKMDKQAGRDTVLAGLIALAGSLVVGVILHLMLK